ncbi:MAG: type II secretion system minor pseudopilin GspJ [Methylomonas sp.]|nr:type II secretion system minor pseudopilin GspJ [Methylomonas sp.]PPD24763.1 MAG: type II secretion system protein GspJ [Methylomonas sp.]PPD33365.1 MAG: type II secretion system protein GspJ [Methylomonas sp.]
MPGLLPSPQPSPLGRGGKNPKHLSLGGKRSEGGKVGWGEGERGLPRKITENQNPENPKVAGFTLLELLIAMAIFAIMAVMAYGGLRAVLDTAQATSARAERNRQLQRTLTLLHNDLMQAQPRPVRDALGDDETALRGGHGDELLSLTRALPDLTQQDDHSRLQRISYHFHDGHLQRRVWNRLDRTQASAPMTRDLLAAEAVVIRFLGDEWTTFWPISGGALPKAVEIVLTMPGLGEIRRAYLLQL